MQNSLISFIKNKRQNTTAESVVKLLTANDQLIFERDEKKDTPLHTACFNKCPADVVSTLIDFGGTVNARNTETKTPLMLAAAAGNTAAIPALVERGAEIDGQDKGGWTPLHFACYERQRDAAAALIGASANPAIRDKCGKTPYEVAKDRMGPEIANELEALRAVFSVDPFQSPTAMPPNDATTKGAEVEVDFFQRHKKKKKHRHHHHHRKDDGSEDDADTSLIDKHDDDDGDGDGHSSPVGNYDSILEEGTGTEGTGEESGEVETKFSAADEGLEGVGSDGVSGSESTVSIAGGGNTSPVRPSTGARPSKTGKRPDAPTAKAKAKEKEKVAAKKVPAPQMKKVSSGASGASGGMTSLMSANRPHHDKHSHDEIVSMAEILDALCVGGEKFNRGKISLFGDGRMGKTAFARSVKGDPFTSTKSTVGIEENLLRVDVAAGTMAEGAWELSHNPEKQMEASIARLIAERRQSKTSSSGGSSGGGSSSGAPPPLISSMSTLRHMVSLPSSSSMVKSASMPILNSSKAPEAHSSPVQVEYEEDYVARYLADKIVTSSKMSISLLDFGGQAAFNVIHHLFISPYGISLLVFSMEWLFSNKEECLQGLNNWINAIVVHAYDDTVSPPTMCQIVFVGTHKDVISSAADHEKISNILHAEFYHSIAWAYLLSNEDGVGVRGTTTLNFFPVDNTLGRADPTVKSLMTLLEQELEKSEFVNQSIPFTWLKCLDLITERKETHFALSEVQRVAESINLVGRGVTDFLQFMNKMNVLMWIDEDGLREVVILDPISYFVTPATMIISKLVTTEEDTTLHETESHRRCRRQLREDYDAMVREGIVASALIPILLEQYNMDRINLVVALMVKFGLLVPIEIHDVQVQSSSSIPSGFNQAEKFIAPALLPVISPSSSILTDNWCQGRNFSTCFIWFSQSKKYHQQSCLTVDKMTRHGLLPRGFFERLLCKAIEWSSDTADTVSHPPILFKSLAIMFYGGQRFRLQSITNLNCIRIDIADGSPVAVQERLSEQAQAVISESMKSLKLSTWVEGGTLFEGYLSLEAIRQCVDKHARLFHHGMSSARPTVSGGDAHAIDISPEDLKAKVGGQWIIDKSFLDNYDAFLSYRWAHADKKITQAIFDRLTMHNVTSAKRPIFVFKDTHRLQNGRDFMQDFTRSLIHSSVLVPIITDYSLEKMHNHDPSTVDNVLLEWIIGIVCYEADDKHKRIFPVLLGASADDDSDIGDVRMPINKAQFDTFSVVVPHKTIEVAIEILTSNGIDHHKAVPHLTAMTMRQIMQRLVKFLYYSPRRNTHIQTMVKEICNQLVDILNSCVPAVLNTSRAEAERKIDESSYPSVATAWDILVAAGGHGSAIEHLLKEWGASNAEDLHELDEPSHVELSSKLKCVQQCQYLISVGLTPPVRPPDGVDFDTAFNVLSSACHADLMGLGCMSAKDLAFLSREILEPLVVPLKKIPQGKARKALCWKD